MPIGVAGFGRGFKRIFGGELKDEKDVENIYTI